MSMTDERFPQGTDPSLQEAAQRAFEDEVRGVPKDVLDDLGEPDLDAVAQQSLSASHPREITTGRFQHGRRIVRGKPHAPHVSREDIEARKGELEDATVPATEAVHPNRRKVIPADSEIGVLIAQTHQHLKDSVPLTNDEKAELEIYLREEDPDSASPRPVPPIPPVPPQRPTTE